MLKCQILAMAVAVFAIGCSAQTDQQPPPALDAHADQQSPPAAQPPPPPSHSPVVALPFRGRLVQGDPNELPPAVQKSLSSNSPITFSYREELTHDEYHIPRLFTAIDPVTYLGAPLGDFGVTAFATLTIFDGDRVLGDYTAKTRVSKSYTIYSQPTHAEIEREARAAVRQKIDDQLYRDAGKLERETASPAGSQSGTLDR